MVNGVFTLCLVSLVIMVISTCLQFFLTTNHCGKEGKQASKLKKKSSRNFATGYQNLVAESSRCIFMSAV